MLIITTETYPGKEIKSVMGLVSGSTVQCKHMGKYIGVAEMVAYGTAVLIE
ncbi:MAG: heavy metal-binding domain-containing protein [Clostridium sp.]